MTEIPAFVDFPTGAHDARTGAIRAGLGLVQRCVQGDSLGAMELQPPDAKEADLIARAKRDRHAFAELYRSHYDAVARYILRRVGNASVTDDLVADVFLTAMKALPRYQYRGIPIQAWFYRLATNTVNRWARRRRHVTLSQAQADGVTTSAEQSGQIERDRTRSALLSLKPKHQTVLALHYLEGMPLEDVAAVTGWRMGTVKSRLSRARVALREKLSRRR